MHGVAGVDRIALRMNGLSRHPEGRGKVYKTGDEAERQAYIVGKTADGRWAGLKTTVVET